MPYRKTEDISIYEAPDIVSKEDASFQAARLVHSSIEAQKNRDADKEAAKAKADTAKAEKIASVKINPEAAHYSSDNKDIEDMAHLAMSLKAQGYDPSQVALEMKNRVNLAKSQYEEQKGLDQANTALKTTFGDAYDASLYKEQEKKNYDPNVNANTRQEHIETSKRLLSNPYLAFSPTTYAAMKAKDPTLHILTYTANRNLQGKVDDNTTTVKGRFLVDSNIPLRNAKGEVLLNADGTPQVQKRPPSTFAELEPQAQEMWASQPEPVQVMTRKKLIHDNQEEANTAWTNYKRNIAYKITGDATSAKDRELNDLHQKDAFLEGWADKKAIGMFAKQMFEIDDAQRAGSTSYATPKPDKESKSAANAKNSGFSGTNYGGIFVTAGNSAGNQSTNVGGSEHSEGLHAQNYLRVSATDAQGMPITPKPLQLNLLGGVRDINTNKIIPLKGMTDATIKNFETDMYIGGRHMVERTHGKDKNGKIIKIPPRTHAERLYSITHALPSERVDVNTNAVFNVVGKDNQKGVMTPEELARMHFLAGKKKDNLKKGRPAKDGNPAVQDEAEELSILQGKNANLNQALSSEAVESGIFTDQTGFKTLEDARDSPNTNPETRQTYQNMIELRDAAIEHNKIYYANKEAKSKPVVRTGNGGSMPAKKVKESKVTGQAEEEGL